MKLQTKKKSTRKSFHVGMTEEHTERCGNQQRKKRGREREGSCGIFTSFYQCATTTPRDSILSDVSDMALIIGRLQKLQAQQLAWDGPYPPRRGRGRKSGGRRAPPRRGRAEERWPARAPPRRARAEEQRPAAPLLFFPMGYYLLGGETRFAAPGDWSHSSN